MDISLCNYSEMCSKIRKNGLAKKCTEVRIFMRPGCAFLGTQSTLHTSGGDLLNHHQCAESTWTFSLSQFVLFLHIIPDMMRSDLCVEHWLLSDSLSKQKTHWIITINGKMNVWKCKLIFNTNTLQQNI